MSSPICYKRWKKFFPPRCWRHSPKSYLSDGTSAKSWNNMMRLHCFLMIYLNRSSSKKMKRWMASISSFLGPPGSLSSVTVAISWLYSLGNFWRGLMAYGLTNHKSFMFHEAAVGSRCNILPWTRSRELTYVLLSWRTGALTPRRGRCKRSKFPKNLWWLEWISEFANLDTQNNCCLLLQSCFFLTVFFFLIQFSWR